jgi:YbgC/YbaW family acyl-CoA thioester hydrolase
MTQRSDFRHFDRLRVRWAEIDSQQIVFNGHYLMYIDTAVASYWRALAAPYHETMALLQGDLYVRKATLEYQGSARYDDLLDVGLRFGPIGKSSIRIAAAVFRGETVLVHGELVYVFADPATMTSRAVPDALRALIDDYEARRDVVRMQIGSWAQLGAAARTVREPVFVAEQGIDAALVHDELDAACLHAAVFNRFEVPVAAGRLLPSENGTARIGRMATLAPVRGAGLASRVLAALTGAARARGDTEVALYAQTSAIGFYARHGYAPHGEPFAEAGIGHQEMRKRL